MSSAGRGRRRPKKHEEEEHENHERWLVSYADMVTLLMCLFIVLFAISQVDKAKFAALASGLSQSFGAPITALPGVTPEGSVLDSLPSPADIEAGVAPQQPATQQQAAPAAAEAAVQRSRQVAAEAQAAYDRLAAIRDRIDAALHPAGYAGAGKDPDEEAGPGGA